MAAPAITAAPPKTVPKTKTIDKRFIPVPLKTPN
jgi:hypothetical protein